MRIRRFRRQACADVQTASCQDGAIIENLVMFYRNGNIFERQASLLEQLPVFLFTPSYTSLRIA
jgi:hypothetical protein